MIIIGLKHHDQPSHFDIKYENNASRKLLNSSVEIRYYFQHLYEKPTIYTNRTRKLITQRPMHGVKI